ncbi:MAG: 50S ribosomal protein L30 [Myxococcales bacterium]|nr:50S ribosomal protein L30 [Myxococcales bacterium]
MAKKLQVTQVRSVIGRPQRQRATLRSLGLRKIGHSVEINDTPELRGMIRAIEHLVEWKEVQNG